jgi:hypothetical protein
MTNAMAYDFSGTMRSYTYSLSAAVLPIHVRFEAQPRPRISSQYVEKVGMTDETIRSKGSRTPQRHQIKTTYNKQKPSG